MYTQLIQISLATLLMSCNFSTPHSGEAENHFIPNSIESAPTSINIAPKPIENKTAKRNAEIVFCLDATGSMSGLIGTAKEKIWDIVSELAQSEDIDTLKMGMVFYRDRGDRFVTKKLALSSNLDDVYADLLEMNADEGGDTPESVNQALHESVNDLLWSEGANTYRTIFVVGDCPPHMDYGNDVPYTISCKQAAKKGIVINTIKLGNSCLDAIPHFKKMANCSQGEFLQLDQNASDYVVETPYDKKINEVSKEIDNSRMYYGNKNEQRLNNESKRKSLEVYEKSTISANSARAAYKSSSAGKKTWMGSKEIVKDFSEGEIVLEELKEEELPEELKGKSRVEKEQLLKELLAEREANVAKLKVLNEQRKIYIEQKNEENESEEKLSFSKEVIKVMKEQSVR